MQIYMEPIGFVSNEVQNKKDVSWGEDISTTRLNEEYIGERNAKGRI